MTEYINLWKNYVNFSDRTTRRGYWMAVLFNIIAMVVLSVIAAVTGIGLLFNLYAIAIMLPEIAITVRRLRDAGKAWYFIFLPVIPIIGGIVLLVFLCSASVEENEIPVV